MAYTLLHVHTNNSVLDGFGSPKSNVKRAKELGLRAINITDHGVVSGHVEHLDQCKKNDIKPILGTELYISQYSAAIRDASNRNATHMVVWSKNLDGWHTMMKLVSCTNKAEYYYYKPRISLFNETIEGVTHFGLEHFLDGNIMGFSGHQGSHLSDNLFCNFTDDSEKRLKDLRQAYAQSKNSDIDYYRKFLKEDWLESTCEMALRLEKIFGKGNFYVELQNELDPRDQLALWIHPLIVECLREVSRETGIPAVASSDPHYSRREDAVDQRAMVMNKMKETEESIERKLTQSDELDLMVFFGSDNFYIHSYEEMAQKFTKEELEMTNTIADMIEVYSLAHKPEVPEFVLPKFDSSGKYYEKCKTDHDKFFMYLCVNGARKKQPWTNEEWSFQENRATREDYWKRLNRELDVIFKANLSKYFLSVWDSCMAADYRPADHSYDWLTNLNNNGETDPIPRSEGRGSAAGCLASFLCGITGVDPLLYDLIFERFYNESRNTKDHVSLPDIDTDFAVEDRDWIIEYLKYRYGEKNVGQIITFNRIQGRAAIKDLFRIKGIANGYEIANEICKYIPSEAEIADDIQEIRESGQDYGIIQWAIDNSEKIQEFYREAQYKGIFDQAIRCEGVKRSAGKHASGIIVMPRPVDEFFPMVLDTKTKTPIIGVDMRDAEKLGGVKIDVLGTAILDKLKLVENLVNGTHVQRNRVADFLEETDD